MCTKHTHTHTHTHTHIHTNTNIHTHRDRQTDTHTHTHKITCLRTTHTCKHGYKIGSEIASGKMMLQSREILGQGFVDNIHITIYVNYMYQHISVENKVWYRVMKLKNQ